MSVQPGEVMQNLPRRSRVACRDKSRAIPRHERDASEFTFTEAGLRAHLPPFPQARMATRPALDMKEGVSLTQTQLRQSL